MKQYLFYVSQLYAFAILRPLQEQIRRNGDRIAWFFDRPEAGAAFLREDELQLKTVAEVKAFDPCAVFVPGNVVPDFFPGIKVQVFHGLATDDTGKKGHYRIRGFFDLYCTHGPEGTAKFQELAERHGHYGVVETGWPKLDPMFSAPAEKKLPFRLEDGKSTVLFRSTFSPSLSAARQLLPTIAALSATGRWHWLVTLHPKMEQEVIDGYRALAGPHLDFIESHHELTPVLQAADAMLCDTSSIAIEFQMLEKPLVTYKTMAPGAHLINVTSVDEVEAALATALTQPVNLMTATRRFVDRLHPYRDGNSSQRVLDAVAHFERAGQSELKSKPWNLLRKWKIRRKLGYYHFN